MDKRKLGYMKSIDRSAIAFIAEKIKEGQTLIFPTETSYGLGCDPGNQVAVASVFKIKGRPSDKPLLVVVPTITMAQRYLVWNEALERISKKYWPGPLTVVGRYRSSSENSGVSSLVPGVVAVNGTVAVRVTADPWLQELLSVLAAPLVATSGNLSGGGEQYDPVEIKRLFLGQSAEPDYLVDAGILAKNAPTTIVSVVNDRLEILRQGVINVE
jgi:L-threonylcarbamoyladenylate synthase